MVSKTGRIDHFHKDSDDICMTFGLCHSFSSQLLLVTKQHKHVNS